MWLTSPQQQLAEEEAALGFAKAGWGECGIAQKP